MLGFDGISSFAVSAVKETGCIGLYGVGYRFFFFLIVLGGWGNVVAWSFYMLMTPLFSQPHMAPANASQGPNHHIDVTEAVANDATSSSTSPESLGAQILSVVVSSRVCRCRSSLKIYPIFKKKRRNGTQRS